MKNKLKIGLGEWGFRDLPLAEHFKITRDLGFRTLEFGIGGGQFGRLPLMVGEREVIEFAELKKQYEVQTPFCCLENDFTLPDETAHIAMLEQTEQSMRDAVRFGAEKIRLFAGFTPATAMTEVLWAQLQTAFVRMAAVAAELGVAIAIETHGRIEWRNGAAGHIPTVSTDAVSLQRLLRELPPAVGFNYDPGNLKAADPGDRDYRLELLNSRINYCHLKDWRPYRTGWLAGAPGDDDLDYAALIGRMVYDGVYLIEYEPTEDLMAGLARSIAYLERHFELEYV